MQFFGYDQRETGLLEIYVSFSPHPAALASHMRFCSTVQLINLLVGAYVLTIVIALLSLAIVLSRRILSRERERPYPRRV